jgi:hypothetical protein
MDIALLKSKINSLPIDEQNMVYNQLLSLLIDISNIHT